MSTKDRRLISLRPTSAPPESTTQVDATWDDETVPGLDLDDPLNEFDRVTAIPELPPELYAQRVMESVEDSRVPAPTAPPPTTPMRTAEQEYFSFDSGQPPTERGADSTAPVPAVASHNAPTARPAATTKPAQAHGAARSPGVPPFSPSPTGLELADLNFDSLMSLKPAVRPEPEPVHDPRDPVLELSFEEVGGSDAPKAPDTGPIGEMKDRYAMGDFSGALLIAEGILEANPEDLEAPRYAQS